MGRRLPTASLGPDPFGPCAGWSASGTAWYGLRYVALLDQGLVGALPVTGVVLGG